jgi:hypothetical protein
MGSHSIKRGDVVLSTGGLIPTILIVVKLNPVSSVSRAPAF